jgi:hypothetical protein
MPLLLDGDVMARALHRSLLPDAPLPDVRVQYLRYKPGTNLVVHYQVGLGEGRYDAVAMIASQANLARRAAKPEHVALAQLVDGRSPAPSPLAYDADLNALVQWLPLDLSLPALAEPPGRFRRRLEAAGVELSEADQPSLLAYKPRRRAALRLGRHVLKVYATEDRFATAAEGLRAGARLEGLHTPRCEAALPDLRLTVQAFLPGAGPLAAIPTATQAGALLGRLHAASAPQLRPAPPDVQLRCAASSAGLVGAIVPSLEGRLERLVDQLEEAQPDDEVLVPSHGDFNRRQLLVHEGDLAVVDFDDMCLAPAAMDIANYAAHLVRGEAEMMVHLDAALDALVEGYGSRPPSLSWYLATSMLRQTLFAFRCFEEHWPERVEAMVKASEQTLRL